MDESRAVSFLEKVSEFVGHPVTLDSKISELAIDSLDFLELLVLIDVKFKDGSKCKTIGDLYAHVPA